MADLYTHAFSDNSRLAKSKSMVGLADATYNVIAIPRFALVKTIWIEKKVACGGGATITIGFIGNGEVAAADAFMSSLEVAPNALGIVSSIGGAEDNAAGKYFADASGAITISIASMAALGSILVFADYAVIC